MDQEQQKKSNDNMALVCRWKNVPLVQYNKKAKSNEYMKLRKSKKIIYYFFFLPKPRKPRFFFFSVFSTSGT